MVAACIGELLLISFNRICKDSSKTYTHKTLSFLRKSFSLIASSYNKGFKRHASHMALYAAMDPESE